MVSMTTSRAISRTGSAPRSWAATNSAHSEAPGSITTGSVSLIIFSGESNDESEHRKLDQVTTSSVSTAVAVRDFDAATAGISTRPATHRHREACAPLVVAGST